MVSGTPSEEVTATSPGAESAVSTGTPKREADEGGPGPVRKKKKGPAAAGSSASARGVANLTPEQLAKKRANDREAQRAIRERTKNQIETLERRIHELQSQQPYQDLQAVIREKEAVERENAEMKRRLATIVRDLQPLIGLSEPDAYISPPQTLVPQTQVAPPPRPLSVQGSTPGSAASPASLEGAALGWQPPVSGDIAKSQLNQQRHELRHGLDMGPERLGLNFLLDSNQRVEKIQNGVNGAQDSGQFQHIPMKHDWTAVRHDHALRARGLASNWVSSPTWTGDTPREGSAERGLSLGNRPSPGHGLPIYALPVKNCAPTCPLDSLLLDFLSERKQRAAEGLSAQEVVGPRYPSVSSLLNPSTSAYSHPLSKVFTDVLSTFPDISALPERVAVLYIMFLVMRWQISPTQENYDRLPEWMRPSEAQLYHAHPAWIDHLPHPRMRDKLIRIYNPTEYIFDNFFIPFTTTLRLSWPYEETDTLLQIPDNEEVLINPVFERHLRNLNNWTLGEPFAKAFPALAETCNIDHST